MKKFLNARVKGFLGRTHALLSVMLFCICMLIPADFFQTTIGIMKNGNVIIFIDEFSDDRRIPSVVCFIDDR